MNIKNIFINFWLTSIYNKQKVCPWLLLLYPFNWIANIIVALKYSRHQHNTAKSLDKPIWIIGNLTLGGSGKTQIILALVKILQQHGIVAGIISRGYAAKIKSYPHKVNITDSPHDVGDEAILLAQTGCNLVIDPNKKRAATYLLNNYTCDLILSDDGLQHYNLPRNLELVVIDNILKLGNKKLLPVGPLREPISRLNDVDAILIMHKTIALPSQSSETNKPIPNFNLYMQPQHITTADLTKKISIEQWCNTVAKNKTIHAITAIGNPNSFFYLLSQLNIKFIPHTFIDHYLYKREDFNFIKQQDIIMMTAKDAVKCRQWQNQLPLWVLQVDITLEPQLINWLLKRLN